MAKKSSTPPTLSFRDLVLGAEADTLRQALEARLRIDELIAERQAAYERIAALETQVEEVIGEPGVFPFPAPPLPVAGIDPKADSLTRAAGPATAKKPRAPQPDLDPEIDDTPQDPDSEPESAESAESAEESDTDDDSETNV